MDGIGAIIAFGFGWFFAQIFKLLGAIIRKKGHLSMKEFVWLFVKSGGMPSGHTASFVALSIYLGRLAGFYSPIFALAICTTIIFVYDAVNVRRAVGEQGKLLATIVSDPKYKGKRVKIVEGHTVPQVIIGTVIGIAVGLATFAILN
jgi:acid phosphatase family membrane protein YuiD